MKKEEIIEIELDRIVTSPYQPRRQFSEEELEDLAASIAAIGIIQPPIVRPCKDSNSKFELIAGERRWRAAKLAGLTRIPVLVRLQENPQTAQAALIENIQRVDLNPIDIARALKTLIDQFGFNQEELAKRIGKKRSTVANYLRLLGLPSHLQQSVSSGHITMGHAKAILSLVSPEDQNLLHELILRDNLPVRAAEEAANKLSTKPNKATSRGRIPLKDPNLGLLARQFEEKLGTKVHLRGKGRKGQIIINYYSFDDLERVMNMLEINI